MHANMTDEHRAAMRRLMKLNPTNVHLLTDIKLGQRMDFESLWSRHGPTAARYYLFPSLWEGRLTIHDGQDDERRSDPRDGAA